MAALAPWPKACGASSNRSIGIPRAFPPEAGSLEALLLLRSSARPGFRAAERPGHRRQAGQLPMWKVSAWPSTAMAWPVIMLAAGEARKRHIAAISPGCTKRLIDCDWIYSL